MKKVLDLGCGNNKVNGSIGLNDIKLPGVDVVHNLNTFPYPFKDNEFDKIYANMVLEHLDDLMKTMNEIHRILKLGGYLHIKVPYYTSMDAFTDPTHKNFFSEKSFLYFTDHSRWNFYTKIRFEIVEMHLTNCKDSIGQKIRNLLPFKSMLKYFLLNIYDEIDVIMKKINL